MTRLGDQARIVFTEFAHEGVDHESPLEDQAVLVYKAIHRLAEVNSWPRREWQGRRGRASHFVMRRLIDDLFPAAGRELGDAISGQVNKVLRRTYAVVCIKRHTDHENPVWFVADDMPRNLVDVATGVAASGYRPHLTERELLNHNERRLTPEEAGETRQPGDVVTTRAQQETRNTFTEKAQERRAELQRLWERDKETVYEQVATSPQPIAPNEVAHLCDLERSRTRRLLQALEDEKRLVSRQETREEAPVRTGNRGMPKATRPSLYWPAPGPVPTRTELPPGIEPIKASTDWVERRMAERNGLERRLLDYLENKAVSEYRRIGRIASYMELSKSETKELLHRLERQGKIHVASERWYVGPKTERTRKAAVEEDRIQDLKAEAASGLKDAALVTVGADLDPRLQQAFALLAEAFAEQAPPSREAELAERVQELEGLVSKQKETIDHLRAAIANLS